ncbi:MAG: M12 family metallopeptidase [Bdellovibrio sp.]|nr:M12 family metallopeptidase [Bdellovibrio sp.]
MKQHSYKFYAMLAVMACVLAFSIAKLIVNDSKNGKNTSPKTTTNLPMNKQIEDEQSPTFTIFTAPKVIPGSPPLTRKSMAAQDTQYWQGMDTLEPTPQGFMVEIQYNGKFYVALGDMIVPNGPQGMGRLYPGQRISIPRPRLWPGGRIPHMIDAGLKVKAELKAAMDELREKTGIEFVSAYKQKDFVSFNSHQDQCLSHVGRIGGEQEVWLGPNCKKGEILHELMHTLGFFHEQSRPDRDEYIMVFWENIEKKYWEQFKKISSDFQNLIDSEFDFNSIMLYPPEAFALNPQFATMAKLNGDLYTVNREELSQFDVEKIIDIYKTEMDK